MALPRWTIRSLWVISALPFILLVYLILALLLSVIPVGPKTDGLPVMEILVRTNGVHADVAIPVDAPLSWTRDPAWDGLFDSLPDTRWVAFGWGNREFYLETPTWADLKVGTAVRAATGLGPTAMHLISYPDFPDGRKYRVLKLSEDQFRSLMEFITNQFSRDPKGRFIPIPRPGFYGPDDFFFESGGRYHAFNTCNSWVNNGLKASGQAAALWTPFDRAVIQHQAEPGE